MEKLIDFLEAECFEQKTKKFCRFEKKSFQVVTVFKKVEIVLKKKSIRK